MHKYAACVIGKFSDTSVKIKFLRHAACYGLKKKQKTKQNKKTQQQQNTQLHGERANSAT